MIAIDAALDDLRELIYFKDDGDDIVSDIDDLFDDDDDLVSDIDELFDDDEIVSDIDLSHLPS